MSFVSCLSASFRCLRCWLLVVARMAAVPIFDGGGEPARDADTDAETMDAVSLTISLGGVSGRIFERDMALDTAETGEAMGGTSVLGVGTTRSVFGAGLAAAGDELPADGVGSGGNAAAEAVAGFSGVAAIFSALGAGDGGATI